MRPRISTRIDDLLLVGVRTGVVLVLLMPLAVTGTFPFPGDDTLFPFIVGKAIYARFLIELIFAGWIILVMRNASYRPPRSWVLWLFGIWVLASFLAAVTGVSFQRSFWGDFRRMGGVFDLVHWMGFLIVLVSVFRSAREWNRLLNASVAVGLVVSLLGLLQHFEVRLFPRYLWYLQSTDRIDSTFGNPTFIAVYLMVTILIALGLLARSFEQRQQLSPDIRRQARQARQRRLPEAKKGANWIWALRLFWVTTAALGLWVMTLSGSRGSAIGLVAALIFVGVGYTAWGFNRVWRYLTGALVAGVVVLALAVPVVRDTALFQKLTESNVLVARFDRGLEVGFGDSFHARYVTARFGIVAFLHAPVLGWGPENFAVAFDRYVDGRENTSSRVLADQAHNKIIGELTTKGFIGFTAYLLLIGWLAWTVVRAILAESHQRLFVLFMGAAGFGYLVQNLMLFDTPGTFLLFVLLTGWVANRETQLQTAATTSLGGEGGPSAPGEARRSDVHGKEGASRLRGWLQGHGVRPELMVNAATVLVVLLTLASIYFYIYRPYHAAQIFPLRGSSIEGFFAQAQDSFSAFPPLSTLGRQVAFDTLSTNWGRVNPELEATLLDQVQSEGQAAIRSEPQNARLRISLARIYQAAGETNVDYLPLARPHVEAALKLAPRLFETIELDIRQDILEGQFDVALSKVFSYPSAFPTDPFRAQLQRVDLQRLAIVGLRGQLGDAEYECRWVGKEDLTLEERAELDCEQPSAPE